MSAEDYYKDEVVQAPRTRVVVDNDARTGMGQPAPRAEYTSSGCPHGRNHIRSLLLRSKAARTQVAERKRSLPWHELALGRG